MRYEAKRSTADKELHLQLPESILSAIPCGEILRLKPQDRLAIAKDGYALIRTSPAKFDRDYSQRQSGPPSLAEWKKKPPAKQPGCDNSPMLHTSGA
jgi:hypothetical protein